MNYNATPALLATLDQLCFTNTWSIDDYQKLSQHSCFFGWVLENKAGLSIAMISFYHNLPEIEILRLGVHPDHRRQGNARSLINSLQQYANSQGDDVIFLEVHEANYPAIQMYKSTGFQEVGRRVGYYKKPQGDAIMMKMAIIP